MQNNQSAKKPYNIQTRMHKRINSIYPTKDAKLSWAEYIVCGKYKIPGTEKETILYRKHGDNKKFYVKLTSVVNNEYEKIYIKDFEDSENYKN